MLDAMNSARYAGFQGGGHAVRPLKNVATLLQMKVRPVSPMQYA